MTDIASTAPARFDIGPIQRAMVGTVGLVFTSLCLIAITRAAAGLAPSHGGAHHLAVLIHLSAVMPAIPLGAWLMLAPKGTPRHKQLGKVWLALMLTTALSAVFIRQMNGGNFSLIHLFVPLTLHGAWKAYTTARRGDIAAHKRGLVSFYIGALVVPGIFAFMPGRLMGVWLLG